MLLTEKQEGKVRKLLEITKDLTGFSEKCKNLKEKAAIPETRVKTDIFA